MIANILSFCRIILAPITVVLILWGELYIPLAFCLFFIGSITDFLDGYFARKYNCVTKTGAFIDPLADKVLVVSLLFSFYWIGTIKLWMLLLIALRDIVVTSMRIITLNSGSTMETSGLAKFKTTIQFGGIYALFIFNSHKINSTYNLISIMMFCIVAFTVWTGVSYLVVNRNIIKNSFYKT